MDKSKLNLPACLIIMDGFGLDKPSDINAISMAEKPNLDALVASCPHVQLQASGTDVGLPAGQMGNSEVGHLNIGAGRIVHQELSLINNACEDGSLAENKVIVDCFKATKESGGVLHMMGLLSNGGVHSSITHLFALIDTALAHGMKKVRVHCFLDGRDVPPTSGAGFIGQLQDKIASAKASYTDVDIAIGSLQGRYYGMDRDKRWDRVSRGYDAIVAGMPLSDEPDPETAVKNSYAAGVTDEFVVPIAFDGRGMKDGDGVIFYNFRPDRAREISYAIVEEDFDSFERSRVVKVHYVCFTEYDPEIPAPIAFPKEFPENVIADVFADAGLKQYHIAETEKYAHVTFFLNGGREEPKVGEERCLIPSPKVATYDLQPEMSEPEVAKTLAEAIREDKADVYIVNFANCDMVGHTGVIPAAVKAVEAVDSGVGEVLAAIKEKGGFAIVIADHGNADKMRSEDGSPHTAHTTAPVPFILCDYTGLNRSLTGANGRLADVAPTLLTAIGLDIPKEMTGDILLAR